MKPVIITAVALVTLWLPQSTQANLCMVDGEIYRDLGGHGFISQHLCRSDFTNWKRCEFGGPVLAVTTPGFDPQTHVAGYVFPNRRAQSSVDFNWLRMDGTRATKMAVAFEEEFYDAVQWLVVDPSTWTILLNRTKYFQPGECFDDQCSYEDFGPPFANVANKMGLVNIIRRFDTPADLASASKENLGLIACDSGGCNVCSTRTQASSWIWASVLATALLALRRQRVAGLVTVAVAWPAAASAGLPSFIVDGQAFEAVPGVLVATGEKVEGGCRFQRFTVRYTPDTAYSTGVLVDPDTCDMVVDWPRLGTDWEEGGATGEDAEGAAAGGFVCDRRLRLRQTLYIDDPTRLLGNPVGLWALTRSYVSFAILDDGVQYFPLANYCYGFEGYNTASEFFGWGINAQYQSEDRTGQGIGQGWCGAYIGADYYFTNCLLCMLAGLNPQGLDHTHEVTCIAAPGGHWSCENSYTGDIPNTVFDSTLLGRTLPFITHLEFDLRRSFFGVCPVAWIPNDGNTY